MTEQHFICDHADECPMRCRNIVSPVEGYCAVVGKYVVCGPVEPVQMMICSGATICKGRCQEHGYAHLHHDDCDETQEFASDCPACVPVEQLAPEPPVSTVVDVDGIRHAVEWSDISIGQPTVLAMCNEIEQLRSSLDDCEGEIIRRIDTAIERDGVTKQLRHDLAASRNAAMILERQRDELRRQNNHCKEAADSYQRISIRYLEQRDAARDERDELKVKFAEAQRAIGEMCLSDDEVTG